MINLQELVDRCHRWSWSQRHLAQELCAAAACRLTQDDDLALEHSAKAFAVARPQAGGQALELGQGRQGALCVAALAPHCRRPITGPHQRHPGEDLLPMPAPSSTTVWPALERAC